MCAPGPKRTVSVSPIRYDTLATKHPPKVKVSFPLLRNPFNDHRAEALTPEQFHYAFGNNLSDEESRKAFDRYAVPGPDHVLFQGAFANFNPHSATTVNFHNDERAPLL